MARKRVRGALQGIHRRNLIYHLIYPYVRVFFFHYYGKVEVRGKENIPLNAPVIFAPNHQNALNDALIVLFSASSLGVKGLLLNLLSVISPREIGGSDAWRREPSGSMASRRGFCMVIWRPNERAILFIISAIAFSSVKQAFTLFQPVFLI